MDSRQYGPLMRVSTQSTHVHQSYSNRHTHAGIMTLPFDCNDHQPIKRLQAIRKLSTGKPFVN